MLSVIIWPLSFLSVCNSGFAGSHCNAEAPLDRGHESANGGHYRLLPDPMDLLRHPDCFAARRPVEPDRLCINFFTVFAYRYFARKEKLASELRG
jgi:hypothetical protein